MNETSNRSGFNTMRRLNESVLCVFIAFLLLLSCPMIRSIEAFVSGSEHAALNHSFGIKKVKASVERVVADTCSSMEALASDRIDETSFTASVSILPVVLVLITALAILSQALQAAHQRNALTRISLSAVPIAETPLYIRHRLLLI